MVSATVTADPAPPAVQEDAPRVYARSARAALDAAKAQRESSDGLYDLHIPPWDAWVQLRRVSFAGITQAFQTAEGDPIKATRYLLRQSFVQPAFSAKEVDEILDDPDQLEAALLLNEAVARINKLAEAMRRMQEAAFRTGH